MRLGRKRGSSFAMSLSARVEVHHLLPDAVPNLLLVHLLVLKVELEDPGGSGLRGGVVQGRKVRVLQGLLHGDALAGVELQHLLEEVDAGV